MTLAWLLAQGDDIIPIPGTKKIKVRVAAVLLRAILLKHSYQYLKENIAAANVKLTPEEIAEVREIANAVSAAAVGERYPPSSMQWVLKDTPPLET